MHSSSTQLHECRAKFPQLVEQDESPIEDLFTRKYDETI